MNRSIFKTRRFRYGSLAFAITALLIAVVIVFNAIFGVLASRFGWYIDMTGEKVFTLSEEGKQFIADLRQDVYIYFGDYGEDLMSNSNMRYIYQTALQLQNESPYVHVECHDVIKEKGFFEEYYSTKNTTITATSVVIAGPEESVVLTAESFFVLNDSDEIWAYNGEYRMISSLLQVTQSDSPVVYFTSTHGEDIEGASALVSLFRDNGFTVMPIDLKQEEISPDARIIVVYDPKYDFIGYEAEDEISNEIDKLDDFMDNLGGLLVFESPDSSENLTNLNEYLEEWGISYASGTYVKSPDHAMTTDGLSIVTEYAADDTLGSSFYSEITSLATPPASVVRNACPIDILWEEKSDNGTRRVGSMLSSYAGSELYGTDGSKIGSAEDNDIYSKDGKYDVAVMSYETRVIDNDYYYSYVMASTPTLATNNYIISNAYGNSDVIYSVWKFAGRQRVLADLNYKPFDDTTLTVTTAEANNYTVAMTVVLPVIIAIVGTVIIIRRKYS